MHVHVRMCVDHAGVCSRFWMCMSAELQGVPKVCVTTCCWSERVGVNILLARGFVCQFLCLGGVEVNIVMTKGLMYHMFVRWGA